MIGFSEIESKYGWEEPLAFLTEDILNGFKTGIDGKTRTPHTALLYHGDRMAPEAFCHAIATGTYRNRSRRYDTGLYCVRQPERVMQNGYGIYLYELYCRGLDKFFCTKIQDYKLMHPESKCGTNGYDFIKEQLLNTGDFEHDPDATEILAKNIYQATRNITLSSQLGAIAMRIISLYSRITSLFNGILYFGSNDGDCALVWNFNCVTPVGVYDRHENPYDRHFEGNARDKFVPLFKNGVATDVIRNWRNANPGLNFTRYGSAIDSKNFFLFEFTPETIYKFARYANQMESALKAGKPVDADESTDKVATAMFNRLQKAIEKMDRDDELWFGKLVSGLVSKNNSVSATNSAGRLNNQWLDLSKLQTSSLGSVALAKFYKMAADRFAGIVSAMDSAPTPDEAEAANPFFKKGSADYSDTGNGTTERGISIRIATQKIRERGLQEAKNAAANCLVEFLCGRTRAERDFWRHQLSDVLPGIAGGALSLRELMRDKYFLSSRLLGFSKDANYADRGMKAGRSEILPSRAYETLFAQLSKFQQQDESRDEFVMSPALAGCYIFSAFKEGRQPDAKMLQTLHSATDLFDRVDTSLDFGDFQDPDIKQGFFASRVVSQVISRIINGWTKYRILGHMESEMQRDAAIFKPDPAFKEYLADVVEALCSQL